METVLIALKQLVLLHTVTVTGCLVNEALHKPASMYPLEPGRSASTAVNGKTDVHGYGLDQIIVTGKGYPAAWWKVDLQREVQDATVRIYFRTDYTPRRNGVKLYTSTRPFSNVSSSSNSPEGHLCHTVTGKQDGSDIPSVYNTTCSGRLRYLLLYTNTNNRDNRSKLSGPTLDFGEVMVLVHYYGTPCNKPCSSRKCVTMPTICERDGRCPDGCQTGWTGVDCTQACDNDHYGPDCSFNCTDRKCLHPSSACDHVTGQCVSGCQAGFQGADCKQVHYYGTPCNKPCSSRKCVTMPTICERDGRCPDGCQTGWTGVDCTQACDNDHYGPDCSFNCTDRKCLHPSSACDHVTGQCVSGCQAGFQGADCKQECGNDHYGPDCRLSCTNRKCLDPSAVCDHVTGQCAGGCQSGYNGTGCTQACSANVTYGANCEKTCIDRHCLTSSSTPLVCDTKTGQCPDGCELAWRGVDCTSQCPAGTFGSDCTSCSTRHCQGESNCPADGTCSQGCQDGWTGNTCKQACPGGYYGPGCSLTCGQCIGDNICNYVTGNCPGDCQSGWRGPQCQQECESGQYGVNCAQRCGQCNGTCDQVLGHCPDGCLHGFCGLKCDLKLADDKTSKSTSDVNIETLIGTLIGTIFLVLLLGSVVLLCLTRQGRLKWINNSDKNKTRVSRDTLQMSHIARQPADVSEHAHRSSHMYNNDYDVLDPGNMHGNKDYDVIKQKEYANA